MFPRGKNSCIKEFFKPAVKNGGHSQACGNMKSRGVEEFTREMIENFSSEIRQFINR